MSTTPNDQEDELAGTEQPFVAHLVELRDRLIKAIIAVAVVAAVLALYPGPAALYDIMAAPLVATLPKGATLIATSVISPFIVPLKILLMAAFRSRSRFAPAPGLKAPPGLSRGAAIGPTNLRQSHGGAP